VLNYTLRASSKSALLDETISFSTEPGLINYFLTKVYHKNYWVSGLCSTSGILNTKKRFGNWICFHYQVRGGRHLLLGSLRKS
jgi:hypothetical protein